MHKKEFLAIRHNLGKTQVQMAQLLGTSLKAVQSFEQGWRNISVPIERQMLFLLAMKVAQNNRLKPCWEIDSCPMEKRQKCPAWEFQSGDLCWFINGTICHGQVQENWKEKIKKCRECDVLRSVLENLEQDEI